MIDHKNFEFDLLNSIPLGICIIDNKFNVIFWNDTISDWTSIDSSDIRDNKLYDFFPRFQEQQYRMRLDNVFTGGPPVILSSQFHKGLFNNKNSETINRSYHIIASHFTDNTNTASVIFTVKDTTDTENLIHKYRDMKNSALEEVEKRKKTEQELIEANRNLEFQANSDQLTKLFNRRKFLEIINNEIDRVKRNTDPFSVIFIDIDNFKYFNSKYGHDCGDYVLKQTADFFINSIRRTDTAARWGGEEFIILLPETDISKSLMLTEKLRRLIEKKHFLYSDKKLNITMTFGIAMYNRDEDSVDSVINRADDALSQGKLEGKNKVISR